MANSVHAHAGAEPERVRREIEEVLGLDCSRAILASAKAVCPLEISWYIDGTRFPGTLAVLANVMVHCLACSVTNAGAVDRHVCDLRWYVWMHFLCSGQALPQLHMATHTPALAQ